jgi:hypothetical protein
MYEMEVVFIMGILRLERMSVMQMQRSEENECM